MFIVGRRLHTGADHRGLRPECHHLPTSTGTTVKGDGTGETIALIEMYHDPNLASDLHTFDQQYGLPDPTLDVINQAGNQTDNGWALEESLDVEWAHAIAPGANILVVEAAPGRTMTRKQLQNLMTAVNTASTTPGVAVVSMSWGFTSSPARRPTTRTSRPPGSPTSPPAEIIPASIIQRLRPTSWPSAGRR